MDSRKAAVGGGLLAALAAGGARVGESCAVCGAKAVVSTGDDVARMGARSVGGLGDDAALAIRGGVSIGDDAALGVRTGVLGDDAVGGTRSVPSGVRWGPSPGGARVVGGLEGRAITRSSTRLDDQILEEVLSQGIDASLDIVSFESDDEDPPAWLDDYRRAADVMGANPGLIDEAGTPGSFAQTVTPTAAIAAYGVLVRTTDDFASVLLDDDPVEPSQLLRRCADARHDCFVVACPSDEGDCLRAARFGWDNARRAASEGGAFLGHFVGELVDVYPGPAWITDLAVDPVTGSFGSRVLRIGR